MVPKLSSCVGFGQETITRYLGSIGGDARLSESVKYISQIDVPGLANDRPHLIRVISKHESVAWIRVSELVTASIEQNVPSLSTSIRSFPSAFSALAADDNVAARLLLRDVLSVTSYRMHMHARLRTERSLTPCTSPFPTNKQVLL